MARATNKSKTKTRGKILVAGKNIYFANDGCPFTRLGIIALCMANVSDKTAKAEDKPSDDFPKVADKKWIAKINWQQVNKYKISPNDLIADRRAEEGATKDYHGRWLFEVLQNMDDAIGPGDSKKFIGTKGLGFLAVFGEFWGACLPTP